MRLALSLLFTLFTFVIYSQNIQVANTEISNPTCADTATGIVTLHVTGGTAPYTFSWQDSFVTDNSTRTGLAAGEYSVEITDSGAVNSLTVVVLLEVVLPTFREESIRPTLCDPGVPCSGRARLDVPAEGVYDITWSSGSKGVFGDNLCEGLNTVTITESISGCTFVDSVMIPCVQPDTVLLYIHCLDELSCDPVQRVSVGATGFSNIVSASFSVSWDTANVELVGIENTHPDFADTLEVSVLPEQQTIGVVWFSDDITLGSTIPDSTSLFEVVLRIKNTGEHLIKVSNDPVNIEVADINSVAQTIRVNNCTLRTVDDPIVVEADIQSSDCVNDQGGSIQLDVTGGMAPYNYLWSTGDTGAVVDTLAEGIYSVSISEESGCRSVREFQVEDINNFTVDLVTIDPVSCPGDSTATLGVQAESIFEIGTYEWSDGSNGSTLSGLSAGTYAVTVEANRFCRGSAEIGLADPSPIFLADSILAPDNGSGSGQIAVIPGGGEGPYSYSWSTGDTTQIITGLTNGTYQVIVTDALGCMREFSLTIGGSVSVVDLYEGRGSAKVLPNPTDGRDVTLRLDVPDQGHLEVSVFDAKLSLLYRAEFGISAGINDFTIPLGSVSGMYFVRLNSAGGVRTLPVIKK